MGAATMRFLWAFASLLHFAIGINFPGLRIPNSGPLKSAFTAEPYTDVLQSGATRVNPVMLQLGEGRQFMSPGYDGISSYLPESKCLWTFAPAPGTALKFTCSKFSVTPMDPVGERCRGDFLRFYDLAVGNSLDDTGERYCHSTSPNFFYNSEIQVLFRSNPDTTVSTGFDCEVVASTATTTTTTTLGPQASDCTTIDGPGVGKACMPFSYGSHRTAYDGCINRAPPGQYVAVVPSFDTAPSDVDPNEEEGGEFDFVEPGNNGFSPEFGFAEEEFDDKLDAISFGPAPRRPSAPQLAPRHGEVDVDEMVFRSLFWCATEVDPSGYVMEWGKCNAGCKADPAGSYIPFSPRRASASQLGSRVNGMRFTHSRRGDTVGQLAAFIRAINKKNRGPN